MRKTGGRPENCLHLDAGGWSDLYTDMGREAMPVLLAAYERMGVDAVNISSREMAFEAGTILALEKSTSVPFISANIIDEFTGEPVFTTHLVLEVKGTRFGIIGITEPVLRTWTADDGRVIGVDDPVAAARGVIDAMKDDVDVVILLANWPRYRVEELAEALPEVDFILGADGYSVTNEELLIGTTHISYTGSRGKNIGSFSFEPTNGGISGLRHRMTLLALDMPKDAAVEKLIAEHLGDAD